MHRLLFVTISVLYFSLMNAQEPVYYVNISTNMGNMKVKLYNETPNHRDNFLKLVGDQHFNGTLFYRVVKGFVIQGGSSDSRNAAPGRAIGYGKAINIDAEYHENCFHKRGAICAPRQPEEVNHFKMSDVSQFYIVQGRKYTNEELDMIEKATNNPIKIELKRQYYLPHKEELARLKKEDPKAFNKLLREIKDNINFHYSISDKIEFSEQQRQQYSSIGGTPELDGDYTVFGEVVEGLSVINKIASLPVDKNNRPQTDVTIKVSIVTQ
ncbi:peptidylprolyl isomerase [Carboxylicivirga sediminis]|uniref:peptidylprolyl isomerase n=1 Tax=Carboxylicivirga sediminis TaxID=2006564 RepID=A0A941F567_9BACT|nr:peptidylprolyl isomerase [Carboxylicivirga sediminis]MBR8537026.1 peptidylprolyl isomerase [Carboxylicivirga sediminis]